MKTFSKHLIEIRFKPNSRFLDKRGEIAEILSDSTLDQWEISPHRIDFSNKEDNTIRAFLSFKNIGFYTDYPNATNTFLSKTKDFIHSAQDYFPHDKIIRIGVRSTTLVESHGFKESFDKFRKKFLALSDEDLGKFGGDLIDFGFPLNFAAGEDFFNINADPMEKEQSKEMLTDNEDLPGAGIYVDIDYFRNEISPHTTQRITFEFVERAVKKAVEVSKLISEWTAK